MSYPHVVFVLQITHNRENCTFCTLQNNHNLLENIKISTLNIPTYIFNPRIVFSPLSLKSDQFVLILNQQQNKMDYYERKIRYIVGTCITST